MKKLLIACVGVLVIGSCIFMFIISPITLRTGDRKMPEATTSTDEIKSGIVIEEKFNNITDNISEIAIVFSRLYEQEDCSIIIELLNGNDLLTREVVYALDIPGDHRTYVKPASQISGYVGKELTLRIYSDTSAGTGLAVMVDGDDNSMYTMGGNTKKGTLCFSITGK